MNLNGKPKIIFQVFKPHTIGGTTTLFHSFINGRLSHHYDFIPLVSEKTRLSLTEFIHLIKYFKRENPDLIEVQGANIEVFPIIMAAKLAGKKILMSVHGIYSDLRELNIFKRLICKYVTEPLSFYLSDAVYTVCEYAAKRKHIIRFSRNLLGYVYNQAPDYSIYNKTQIRIEVRNELGICLDDHVALYIGRITYDKGATFFTQALMHLSGDWPENLKVIIVGDGSLKTYMESQLKTLVDLKRVHFMGIRQDVHRYCYAADFLISPSLHENHSLTIA